MLAYMRNRNRKNSAGARPRRSVSASRFVFLRVPFVAATLLLFFATSTAASPQLPPPPSTPATPQLRDASSREGPFTVDDNQQYSVLFQYKVLPARASSSAASGSSSSTLWRFDVLSSQENSVYHQTFAYTVTQGRLQEHLTASASLLRGDGGVLLVIRFLDHPDRTADRASVAKESWQLFSISDEDLVPLGPILPLGHGENIAVGGVMAAVMMKGGIAVMPMASTAEVLAIRAWTGNFYASVPVRFDWADSQWGEGEQCYRTADGTLTERGCIIPVEAIPTPRSPDADFPYVQLFVTPDGNTDGSQNILITSAARIEFLEMQAIVRWHNDGQRVACTFSDVWLRTRINGNEGWVHGQDAFAALGLPQADPQ